MAAVYGSDATALECVQHPILHLNVQFRGVGHGVLRKPVYIQAGRVASTPEYSIGCVSSHIRVPGGAAIEGNDVDRV